MTRSLSIVVCCLLFILTLPLWLGLAGGLFGLTLGLIGALFGIVFGFIGAIFAGIAWIFKCIFGILFGWHHGFGWHSGLHFNGFLFAALIIALIVVATRKKS